MKEIGKITHLSCSPSGRSIAAMFTNINLSSEEKSYSLVTWHKFSVNGDWEWTGGAQLKFDSESKIRGTRMNWLTSADSEYLYLLTLLVYSSTKIGRIVCSMISLSKIQTGQLANGILNMSNYISIPLDSTTQSLIQDCVTIQSEIRPYIVTSVDNKLYILTISIVREQIECSILWTDVRFQY